MRKLFAFAGALLLAQQSVLAQAVVRPDPDPAMPSFVGWVPNKFIVVLESEARDLTVVQDSAGFPVTSEPGLQAVIERQQVESFRRQFPSAKPRLEASPFPDLTGHYKVRLRPGTDLDAAINEFENDPNVESVEKIGIHRLYNTPNDSFFQDSPDPNFPFDQWHLWDVHSIDADLAWDAETGDSNVSVGILDSGTRYFHLDLGGDNAPWGPDSPSGGGNIFMNPGEIAGNGLDDDGNGFIDDTIGWDFVTSAGGFGVSCIDQDCSGADNDPDDGDGHGTHVSGTVGAITNNGILVAGVAGGFSNGARSDPGTGVKIIPLRIGYHARFQGQVTGVVQMDWAAEAMNYVADLVDAGQNVAAINCSWGSSNSGGLNAAVDNLLAHDVMIVHAAGNSNSSSPDFLGGKAGVMNVAATDINGSGASFTNHGSWVDVAAPGVDVVSTFRNPDDPDPNAHYIALLSGTSMSAPHICGVAALLESCTPSLNGPDKFNLIVNNTDPYSDSRDLGSGIANAKLALDAAGCGGVPCDITADFSASQTSGCATLTTDFTDLSTGTGIDQWAWDFGDGNTSAAQNPSHSYTAAGVYSVSLTASSSTCSDSTTKNGLITVSDVPIADFSGSPTNGTEPLTVVFSDTSSGNPASFSWDFGDGNTSTEQNPTHTYNNAGTYSVTLTVTNSCGSDVLTRVDYITVNEVGNATSLFVSDIFVVRVNEAKGFKHAETTVTILDNNGMPVSGATVTGDYSGKTNDTGVSGTTDANGQVTLSSTSEKGGGGEWCFKVTNVTHSTLIYDAQLNNVTQSCENGDVF